VVKPKVNTPSADGVLLPLREAEVHAPQHRQELLLGDLLLAVRVKVLPVGLVATAAAMLTFQYVLWLSIVGILFCGCQRRRSQLLFYMR